LRGASRGADPAECAEQQNSNRRVRGRSSHGANPFLEGWGNQVEIAYRYCFFDADRETTGCNAGQRRIAGLSRLPTKGNETIQAKLPALAKIPEFFRNA